LDFMNIQRSILNHVNLKKEKLSTVEFYEHLTVYIKSYIKYN